MQFVLSADNVRGLPDSPVEVAVIGRSNVGKSSLINALAGRDGLARVSKTPGRTRLLNCFELPGGATVVDCPGYGYAEASKATELGRLLGQQHGHGHQGDAHVGRHRHTEQRQPLPQLDLQQVRARD